MEKRLTIENKGIAELTADSILKDAVRRLNAKPSGVCPLTLTMNLLRVFHSQSCGKCVPCRVGLGQMIDIINDIISGKVSDLYTLDTLRKTAESVFDTADCAIGYEAARVVLKSLEGFRDEYESHIFQNKCTYELSEDIPCRGECPAHVDVPGYISLVLAGKNESAVKLIRKDNPFPSVCAYVCEHPCEKRCRRAMVDEAINICGIKRYAVDNSSFVKAELHEKATGKTVAVVGGGPGGLTCAYYLALMGHKVVVYEQRAKLGGMLRYGIPAYRLPREVLDRDIEHILSTGIEVKYNVSVGTDIDMKDLQDKYDAIYLSIGAHNDKKLGIEGEKAENVISAVKLLRSIGDGNTLDFKGKNIVVIGGGNVAMDTIRTSLRLGAKSVKCIYRRRIKDMTALPEEIDEARQEGAEIISLYAPDHIELNDKGLATAIYCKRQIVGSINNAGRVEIRDAKAEPMKVDCDYIIVAIGQDINLAMFSGTDVKVGKRSLEAESSSFVSGSKNVFAGGDAVSGPATVIKAVAAGKVAANNIDGFLGFSHDYTKKINVPTPGLSNIPACGRVELQSRYIDDIVGDFNLVTKGMTKEEAMQECSRCLRCDHFGYGKFRGGEGR